MFVEIWKTQTLYLCNTKYSNSNFEFVQYEKTKTQNFGKIYYCHTITYKSRLTQKKLHKKTDATFSIYGRNGINPWDFFWILT